MIYEARVNNTPDIDYLKDMNPSNIIPSYASVHEMAYYVIEKSESDFNDMMMDIGINELNYFIDNGTEIVYEAAEDGKNPVAKVGEKFVDFLKTLWTRFQEMIDKTLDFIDKKIDNLKTGAFKDLIKNVDIDAVKDDAKFGKTFNYVVDTRTKDKAYYALSVCFGHLDVLFNRFKSFAEDGETVEDFSKVAEKGRDEFIEAAIGKEYNPAMILKNEFRAELRGTECIATGKAIKENWDSIVENVIKGNESKKAIKKLYNDMKKAYNNCIKETKVISTSFKETANNMKLYYALNKELKNLLHLALIYQNEVISCIVDKYNFGYRVALKLAGSAKINDAKDTVKGVADKVTKGKKNDEIKAKEESKNAESVQHNSAMIESSSITVDRLTSLFDW